MGNSGLTGMAFEKVGHRVGKSRELGDFEVSDRTEYTIRNKRKSRVRSTDVSQQSGLPGRTQHSVSLPFWCEARRNLQLRFYLEFPPDRQYRRRERNPPRQHPEQPSVNAARRPLIGRLDRHQIVRHVRLGRGRRPELSELKPGSFSALERK
jgi:hypothetical protein